MTLRPFLLALCLLLASTTTQAEAPGVVLIPAGATWRYLDDGSDAGTAWRAPAFVDTGWTQGPAQLGYGDGGEATVVNGGPSGNRFITTYFRAHFTVTSPATTPALRLRLVRDDGAVVYLNGAEVARSNMPSGAITSTTLASAAVGGADESTFFEFSVCASLLVAGDNVLAVEIHQSAATSSDVSFDASLDVVAASPLVLLRDPYVQNATPGSAVLRWRTNRATDSRVQFGPAPGALGQSVTVGGCRTDHDVPLSGLSPATRYVYSVGSSSTTLAGDDAAHGFRTPPVPGTRVPLRIWVIGDSGMCAVSAQGCLEAGNVRDAYLAHTGAQPADVWLLLGDNAYDNGTDAEYTAGFFDVYPTVMRAVPAWPAVGNHEFGASDSPTQSGPHYDAFTLPRFGEAGGVPSGTEAYFSFDHGNVHFVALDSHDTDRSAPANPETNVCPPGQGGAMYQWLCADLAATDQDFVIAYFHHPPYTKGSHDSDVVTDSTGRMEQMRRRFLPVLEAHGVDLVLTGHSHSYERSVLLDGHYGTSGTYQPLVHAVDSGDGDPLGDGAYTKPSLGAVPNGGGVHAVVGSSSQTSGGPLNHPVMTTSLNVLGSMLIDVSGRQLDAIFLDDGRNVRDRFRIVKGPALEACANGVDDDGDTLVDHPADDGCTGPGDPTELRDCEDGLDNDGDGTVDMGDAGCNWAQLRRENPQCGDGLDNDADGATDHAVGPGAGDTLCQGAWDDDEAANPTSSCGLLGLESLLALAGARELRRRSLARERGLRRELG